MILEDIFGDNLAVVYDEEKLSKQINAVKRIAEESLTWIEEGRMEAASNTYDRLLGQLYMEVRDYEALNYYHLSPFTKSYVETTHLLSENLPQPSFQKDILQSAYNNIIKELNNIVY